MGVRSWDKGQDPLSRRSRGQRFTARLSAYRQWDRHQSAAECRRKEEEVKHCTEHKEVLKQVARSRCRTADPVTMLRVTYSPAMADPAICCYCGCEVRAGPRRMQS